MNFMTKQHFQRYLEGGITDHRVVERLERNRRKALARLERAEAPPEIVEIVRREGAMLQASKAASSSFRRNIHLAYAIVKGRNYNELEDASRCWTLPSQETVERLLTDVMDVRVARQKMEEFFPPRSAYVRIPVRKVCV